MERSIFKLTFLFHCISFSPRNKNQFKRKVLASGSLIPMELRRDNKLELRRVENLDSQYNEEILYIKQYIEHKILFIIVSN